MEISGRNYILVNAVLDLVFEFLSAGSNNNPDNDGEGQARKDDM